MLAVCLVAGFSCAFRNIPMLLYWYISPTVLCRYTSLTNPQNTQVAWRRKVKPPRVPEATPYAMRIFAGSGTEIPQFTDVANFGRNKKMSVTPAPPSPLSLRKHVSLIARGLVYVDLVCLQQWYQYRASFSTHYIISDTPCTLLVAGGFEYRSGATRCRLSPSTTTTASASGTSPSI